jgi:hypothetical protein
MRFGQGCNPETCGLRLSSGGYRQVANVQQRRLSKISSRERVLFSLILELGNPELQENVNSSYGW